MNMTAYGRVAALAAALTWPALPAPAQTDASLPAARPVTPQAAPSAPVYEINGFRSARFGMTEAEVLGAIQRDFAIKASDVRKTANVVERTSALTARVASLEPGPDSATVVYILGYQSKRLIQVNVVWAREPAGGNKPAPAPYVIAATQLATYFAGFDWQGGKIVRDTPLGSSSIATVMAEDGRTGAVQVVVDGVALARRVDGKTEPLPQPAVRPSLRISYVANRTTPDVFRLKDGF